MSKKDHRLATHSNPYAQRSPIPMIDHISSVIDMLASAAYYLERGLSLAGKVCARPKGPRNASDSFPRVITLEK